MAKHIIILGAGASYTSGYPLADKLRIILSSDSEFKRYTADKYPALAQKLWQNFTHCAKAVRLFREGGFGSIDEFCFLAGSRFQKDVQDLKRFVAFVFALHNPEALYQKPGSREKADKVNAFEHSDYYPFVQKLFDEEFHQLRKDVAILTYNYDPYLEFVLSKAYRTRKEAVTGKKVNLTDVPAFLLSGLGNPADADLLSAKGFCLLKLHGTSVLPTFPNKNRKQRALTFADAIENQLVSSFNRKVGTIASYILTPPIFFPWEIITDTDEFVGEKNFRLFEGETAGKDTRLNKKKGMKSYYPVFKAIWQRAQQEITSAERISFVGISFHKFMLPGLQFLFKERLAKKVAPPCLMVVGPQFEHVSALSKAKDVIAPLVRKPGAMSGKWLQGCSSFRDFIDEHMN